MKARRASLRSATVADQVNPRSKPKTPPPQSDAQCQAVSPNPTGNGDDGGPLEKVLRGANSDFVQGLLRQLLHVSARGPDKFDTTDMLFTLGAIEGAKPTDELAMMQLTQMTAIHSAFIKASGDLARAETVFEREYLTRALNQLARTYTAQLEAFNRYRSGTEHKVTVQNVSVGEGGQAIVGNVTQAGTATAHEMLAKPAPALTDDRKPAMEILRDVKQVPEPVLARASVRPDNKRTGKAGVGTMNREDVDDE